MIPLFKVRMDEAAIAYAGKVLRSGFIGQGPVVEEFEEDLKSFFKYDYVLTTNNATSAEHLALHMLKEKVGGCDVLCTPLTCTATNWPVVLNGYNIKWVDVDDTCNIDLTDLRRKLSPSTKIIYIVHWGGYPIDYMKLVEVLSECHRVYGFTPAVIEDCAHAMGAKYGNVNVGTVLNSYATFSFQAIKHVTCVDGGALVCPGEKEYKRAKLLRWYGIDRENNRKDFRCEADIPEIGFKFHMNDVSAAIGSVNLVGLQTSINRSRECAQYYNRNLRTNKKVRLIPYYPGASYWIYTMFVKDQDKFMEKMKKNGIMVSRVHERNDIHSCVKKFKCSLPNLDRIVKEMICIPCGWWVTDEDLRKIVRTIDEGW